MGYQPNRKVKPNAYKVPDRHTGILAGATLTAAVLCGVGGTYWVIQKINQFKMYATTSVTNQTTQSIVSNVTSTSGGAEPGNTANNASLGTTVSRWNDHPSNTATSTPSLQQQLPSREVVLRSMMANPVPPKALLRVKAQNQHPQLKNGCEVTSLSMLLGYLNHPVDKMTLAAEEPTDPTPLVMTKNKKIVSWGNPEVGFVGNIKILDMAFITSR